MSTPPGKDPFSGAPDAGKAFEQARDNTAPKSRADEQQKSAAEAPQPRPRPMGPMRGMAGSVDRTVQAQVEARKVAARNASREQNAEAVKSPRRVTQLFREAGKDKEKEKEKDRGRS